MNKRKVLGGVAAAATLVLIGSAVPRAARAVYTTPVTVFNANNQAVPVSDVERMARIPYESMVSNNACTGNSNACFFNFTMPPTGYRLVAENIAGYFQISPAASVPVVGYIETGNPQFRVKGAFTAPLAGLDPGGHTQAAMNLPIRFYVDPTDPGIFAVVSTNWSNGNSTLILSGYLENCSVTGCPAVQH